MNTIHLRRVADRVRFILPINARLVRAPKSLAIVLLLVSLCGCSLMGHHKQANAPMLDDKVTTMRVQAALEAKDKSAFKDVQVSTSGGVVTLSGKVRNEAAREQAAQVAKTVHRVEKLENEIQVQR